MCAREPGLFKKGEMYMSVYVDDSLMSGPCKRQLAEEREAILAKFGGTTGKPTMEGDVELRDLLGVEFRYCAARKYMKMSMAPAIDKLLKKFGCEDIKVVTTPVVAAVGDPGKERPDFLDSFAILIVGVPECSISNWYSGRRFI